MTEKSKMLLDEAIGIKSEHTEIKTEVNAVIVASGEIKSVSMEISPNVKNEELYSAKRIPMTKGRIKPWKFQCEHCAYKARQRGHLLRHVQAIHEKKSDANCTECEYEAPTEDDLTAHMRVVHESRVFECGVCEYQALKRFPMLKHYESTHPTKQKFAFYQCEFGSGEKIRLAKNVAEVLRWRVKCVVCGIKVRPQSALLKHMKQAHPEITST